MSKKLTSEQKQKIKNRYLFINNILTSLSIGMGVILSYFLYAGKKFFIAETICLIVILFIILITLNCLMYSKEPVRNRYRINFFRFIIFILCISMIFVCYKNEDYLVNKNAVSVDKVSDNNYKGEDAISFIKMNTSEFEGFEDFYVGKNSTPSVSMRIGTVKDFEIENTNYALKSIPNTTPYEKFEYESVTEMINALYDNKVDMIILNEIYRKSVQNIKTNFDTETVVEYQVKEISDTDEITENSDYLKNTKNIAFIGSFDDDKELEMDQENNIVLLMTICPKTKEILLSNIPINLIGHIGDPEKDELLKYTNRYGSIDLSKSLTDTLHTDFNNYVKFNMNSIKILINGLGSIDVELSNPVKTKGFSFAKGNNEMDANDVIALLKASENDKDAFEYQKAVMIGIINKINAPKTTLSSNKILKDTLGTCERTIDDEYWYTLLQYQLINNPEWTVSKYNIEADESDYIYSKGARRTLKGVKLSKDNEKDYSSLITKMLNNQSIK